MEEAYFLKHQKQPKAPLGILDGAHQAQDIMISRTGHIEDSVANAYRTKINAEYKGDWLRFFLDWKKQQEQQGKLILDTIVQSKDDVICKLELKAQQDARKAQALSQQYESLYDQFLLIQKQTTFLQQAEQQRQLGLKQKLDKKKNIQNAVKQKVRQTISIEEVQLIIQKCIKAQNPYTKARRTVAILILYLTGLRVQNLLHLDTKQLLELLNLGHTEIRLIKGPLSDRHRVRLAYKGPLKLLQTVKQHIFIITHNKTYHMPAFTPKDQPNKAINQDVHEQELNQILITASEMLHKHLRTHSFRATYVTDLLVQGVPIQDVKLIVGPSKGARIDSTLRYDRNTLPLGPEN